MSLLFLVFALSGQAAIPVAPGIYESVTETEYAIELTLEPTGHAELELRMWVAGEEPKLTDAARLQGSWSLAGDHVIVQMQSGGSANYTLVPCLSYEEFGANGCSPGLKLTETTLPREYGLHRFSLWRADSLRVQP